MSKVTELASASINGHDTITVELIEADQTLAVVIVRWPSKPSVFHPRRFPGAAESAARVFAAAVVRLAAIKTRAPAVSTVAVVLEQIRTQLLAEAEHDLAKAEHYQHSRRQGERNSVRIYVERGTVAVQAAALIEQFTVTAPHRSMTALRAGPLPCSPILSHPDPLMFPALTAHALPHISGVRAVLQVIPAGCRQCSVLLPRPFLVGPVSPHT